MQTITINKMDSMDFHGKEAYKSLRTNIQFAGEDVKVISITSCMPNEGKSSVTINLALALAEAGKSVLLIDADMRKSILIGRYQMKNAKKGLSHYLSGQCNADEVISVTNIEKLHMITAGPVPPNPSELLQNRKFARLISETRKIYDYVIRHLLLKTPINMVKDSKEYTKFEDLCLTELNIHTRGFVKVQDGCENFCSYCAIPYSRGPIKSRPMESILKEVLELVYTNGVKEIVLAGINTGTYGKDLGNITLASLIETIMVSVPDLYRLRLSSIELMEITDELLNVLKKYENRIANHLHIPLQSGCDETLIRMNRKYLMNEYFRKIEKIRSMFKDIAITADCLAGFVGETIEEFETTYKNIEKLEYADLHIFPYSRRPNTLADTLPNHLNPIVIKERAHKLQELAKQSKLKYYQKFIDTNMEVLIEQKKNGYWYGHTSNYLEVKIPDKGIDLTNNIVNVKLVKIVNNCILGEEVA